MNPTYLLVAKRDPDRAGGLKIGYPTKEHAIAAVDVIRHLWAIITVTAPDGSLVLHLESPPAQAHQLPRYLRQGTSFSSSLRS